MTAIWHKILSMRAYRPVVNRRYTERVLIGWQYHRNARHILRGFVAGARAAMHRVHPGQGGGTNSSPKQTAPAPTVSEPPPSPGGAPPCIKKTAPPRPS